MSKEIALFNFLRFAHVDVLLCVALLLQWYFVFLSCFLLTFHHHYYYLSTNHSIDHDIVPSFRFIVVVVVIDFFDDIVSMTSFIFLFYLSTMMDWLSVFSSQQNL